MKAKFALGALVVGLLSCSDSGPGTEMGSIIFSYSGAPASPFSVSATFPTDDDEMGVDYVGGVLRANGVIMVAQRTNHGAGLDDRAMITVDRTIPGTIELDGSDCGQEVCTGMGLIVYGKICELNAGSITISEISQKRIKGTFSGTGFCVSAGPPAGTDSVAFSAGVGTFDVALRMDNLELRRSPSSVRIQP